MSVDGTTVFVIAVLFAATLIRTTFGFGEALVAVPLLALRIPIAVATPLAVAVSVVVAAVAVARDWRHVDLHNAYWLIGGSFVGLPFGLLLLKWGSDRFVHLLLGAVIISVSLYSLFVRIQPRLDGRHRGWLLSAGVCSGVLGGAYGMNGPPLAIYGAFRGWSPEEFRATLQGYFLIASIAGLAGYGSLGLWRPPVATYLTWSLPAVIVAIVIARRAAKRLDATRFFRLVFAGLAIIGAVLIVQGIAR
ncbi:MAG TPA: sulfite exporter TauE/SafE family protein [Gemmatimonadaceae bacterium]